MRTLVVGLALLLASPVVAAELKELSADVTLTSIPRKDKPEKRRRGGWSRPPVRDHGRLYVGKNKLRTELNVFGGTLTIIHDIGGKKAFMLLPDRKVAVDLSGAAGNQGPQSRRFHTDATGNPCGSPPEGGATCKHLGSETLDGRDTEVWELNEPDGKGVSTLWVDKALLLVVRRDSALGSVALTNIQEGPQPAELFEVPKGYEVTSRLPDDIANVKDPATSSGKPAEPPPGEPPPEDAPPPGNSGK
jgi:hypothetical protein